MNRSRFWLVPLAAALLPLAGCESLRDWANRHPSPQPKGAGEPLPQFKAEDFVAYVNWHADQLRTVDYGDIRVSASEGNQLVPASLRGSLTASQPRNFRMTGQGTLGAKVDLGSNDKQFWVYVDAPTQKPVYVFASHEDFDGGRAPLPGGLPFEPDWVMQALGMTRLPPNVSFTLLPDQKARTYALRWRATTPNGVAVVKEVVFEGDAPTETKPRVKRHVVYDTKGAVICSAEIRQVKTISLGDPDPRTGKAPTVQYPTSVVLKWEQQKFEMKMELKEGTVNKPVANPGVFNRPNLGTPAQDLATLKYEYPAK
jgi:hypothetical protein